MNQLTANKTVSGKLKIASDKLKIKLKDIHRYIARDG